MASGGRRGCALPARRLRVAIGRHHQLHRRGARLGHCVTDFAGNVGCTAAADRPDRQQRPGPPARPALAGGDGWRRDNDFDLAWENPDQGPASPIGGASWRVVGPAGFDTGASSPPAAGSRSWRTSRCRTPAPTRCASGCATRRATRPPPPRSRCRCASTTSRPASPSRPTPAGLPDSIRADVFDEHSGPAGGEIHYRRLGADSWIELPTKLQRGASREGAARRAAARLARARRLRLPRRRRRRRGQYGLDDAARRRDRDGSTQAPPARREAGDAQASRRRGSSPASHGVIAMGPR